MVILVGKVYLVIQVSLLNKRGFRNCMRLKEVISNIAEREITIKPSYRKIDKHGRLYLDVANANKEFLVILVDPVPEDKINFLKVGRGT